MPLDLQPSHSAEAEESGAEVGPGGLSRLRLSLLILAAGVVASAMLAAHTRTWALRDHQDHERRAVDLVSTALQVKLAGAQDLLLAMKGWIETQDEGPLESVSPEGSQAPDGPPLDFQRFVRTLQGDGTALEGIQAVGLARSRSSGRSGALEVLAVAPATPVNQLLLHQDLRPRMVPLPPTSGGLSRPAAGAMVLTPLKEAPGGQGGMELLLTLPVAPPGGNAPGAPLWVFAQLPLRPFVDASLNNPLIHFDQPVNLRLYEGDRADPARLLYDSRNLPQGPPLIDPESRPLEAGGRRWLLQVQLSRPNLASQDLAWILALVGSLSGTVLVSLAVRWLELRHRRTQEALRRLKQVEGQREEVLERLRLSAETFSLIEEGVVITDLRGTILTCNEAYARISGYTRSELEGRNPRILQSGYHDRAFYEALWHTLTTTGSWQGEIWNRRRSGEVFPQWMQMRVIRDRSGSATHYLATVSDLSRMREKENQLEYLGYHDPLTDLPNLRLAQLRLTQACYARQPLAVMWIDLDGIKRINDSFGHAQGDQVLKAVVDRLAPVLGPDDLLARIGGDEFLVLRPLLGEGPPPEVFARGLLDQLRTPMQVATGLELELTACAGLSLFPEHSPDPDTLLQNAATALTEAKRTGPQTIRFYSPAMTASNRRRLAIESHLQRALECGELDVHYQPQTDASGTITGAEARVRWNSPELGSVPPGEFIPIAEATGLIHRLGEWVLLEACRHWQRWVLEGLAPGRLAVNLSNHQFLDPRQSVPQLVESALRTSGLAIGRLELEITESCLVPALGAREQIEELARLGVSLAVDDFGTGFSSLSMLQSFPVSKLKIDRCFVAGLDASEASRSIVRATLAMAAGLGLATLAEGVERQEELEVLIGYGCQSFQGYLLGKPVPAVAFDELLRTARRRVATGG